MNDRPHIPVLDGIRGLAVVMVVLYHYTLPATSDIGTAWQHLVRGYGWAGVDLFFVLSGFLITGILLESKHKAHYFRNFYARRILRIFPLYYGYLVLVLWLAPLMVPKIRAAERIGGDAIWYWCYLQNFSIAQYAQWPHSQYLNHLWSLAVEEQFYLVWPLIIFLCHERWLKSVCILAFLGSCGLRLAAVLTEVPGLSTHLALYVSTLTRLDGLAIGSLLAVVHQRNRAGLGGLGKPARWATILGATTCALVAYYQGGFHYLRTGTILIGYPALAIGFAGLMVWSLTAPRDGWLSMILSSWLLRKLGKFSYAMYVLHQFVSIASTQIMKRLSSVAAYLGEQVTFYLIAWPLLLLVSWASWHLYEKHFLRLKRYFA